MDPYGHNHHHTSHHRREEPPPPPPHASNFGGPHHHPPAPAPYTADHRREEPPPPPPHASIFGGPHHHPPAPAPAPYTADHHHHSSPAPPQPAVHHVYHETSHHTPPIAGHHTKEPEKYTDHKPTVRFYSKAKTDYSLTIRDGKVILAPSNPSDPHQHWIKDLKFSTKVKDEEGFPSFALVNKATGQAMKHSIGATHPVQLTEYKPDKLDESVLWTESKDLGDGYRAVRMVNNIKLNVDAFNGDKEHGGVHDGTKVVLWEWKKGDNQRWTTAPY